MTEVFSVATWFIGCRRLLGWNRGFLGGDRVVFLCLSVATRAPTMLRQCFVSCCDNVATEVPLSRSRRPRQEVRVATGAWLRLRNFKSR